MTDRQRLETIAKIIEVFVSLVKRPQLVGSVKMSEYVFDVIHGIYYLATMSDSFLNSKMDNINKLINKKEL